MLESDFMNFSNFLPLLQTLFFATMIWWMVCFVSFCTRKGKMFSFFFQKHVPVIVRVENLVVNGLFFLSSTQTMKRCFNIAVCNEDLLVMVRQWKNILDIGAKIGLCEIFMIHQHLLLGIDHMLCCSFCFFCMNDGPTWFFWKIHCDGETVENLTRIWCWHCNLWNLWDFHLITPSSFWTLTKCFIVCLSFFLHCADWPKTDVNHSNKVEHPLLINDS